MKHGLWKKAGAALSAAAFSGALLIVGAAAPNAASAAQSGVFGGGPLYINAASHITELKNSGFMEVIVWNIAVSSTGDMNFNGEFPVCSNGAYTGASTHSDFAGNMSSLKQGSVKRVTFSVGSSNVGDFQHIRDLINAQGTGSTSILYRNFQALKAAIPSLDCIDLDDENCYDTATMVKFCVMLGNLGYKVALDPYTNSGFWTTVASQVNAQRGGTIDSVHLQCYSGGGNNNPCSWNFGGIPVYPGVDSGNGSANTQTLMTNWKNQCQISGGWMWLYDSFQGNAAAYASAINNGIGASTIPNGVYEIAAATTGNALDCYGNGNGNSTPIQLWPYANTNNQKWQVNSLNNGYYSIRTINPDGTIGRSLDCTGCSPNDNTYIELWDWNRNSSCQQWAITPTTGGKFKISTAGTKSDGTHDVLDGQGCSGANNTRILLWSWGGGGCQQEWFFYLR
jgi:hypothetical protein